MIGKDDTDEPQPSTSAQLSEYQPEHRFQHQSEHYVEEVEEVYDDVEEVKDEEEEEEAEVIHDIGAELHVEFPSFEMPETSEKPRKKRKKTGEDEEQPRKKGKFPVPKSEFIFSHLVFSALSVSLKMKQKIIFVHEF